jgi:glucose/arabinose dehydrogenase
MRRGSIALDAAVLALAFGATATLPSHAQEAAAKACPGDDSGLTLSPGFCANVFADGIGHVRHMAVAPNGVLYVNTWSGEYYGNDTPPAGGFLVALQDSQGLGKADTIRRFGETVKTGGAGGTGIALYKGHLYAEIDDRIVRYAMPESGLVPQGPPEVIVSGLPIDGEHPMHPFAIDAAGMLYVDVASATNTCQKDNRKLKSPGLSPCKELETRGGIWRFDANKTGQTFSPAERYVTGIRNAGAIAVDAADAVYATQHGRDQLAENWPHLYRPEQGATLPAEEMMRIEKGAVYGWPHCYFDPGQGKLVLAPEYGGDGGKAVGICAKRHAPVAAFPAHWAPNALLFYQGSQFPARYRDGAFIAFHGSWNRSPEPQAGYNVTFQPFVTGKPAGPFEVFAQGFTGRETLVNPGDAVARPDGIAQAPDGTLYIGDSQRGKVWRVIYTGR